MSAFVFHDPDFAGIVGSNPTLELLVEFTDYPFAHEAGVYFPGRDELFITSNRFCLPGSDEQHVRISKISFTQHGIHTKETTIRTELDSRAVPQGNGGVNYRYNFFNTSGKPSVTDPQNDEDAVLFCAQGSRSLPSGLYAMQVAEPHGVAVVVSDFYGRPFNSVNDVVIHSDGSIWFTDPPYGFEQGYRDRPELPSQVYRYDSVRGGLRAVADGFGHPNGICFSPDEKTVYVTDTDSWNGSGETDMSRASTIYAFDVLIVHGQPFLANRRLFAMTDAGIPDGIKCDAAGNVYSGCGDGVHVWSPGGVLLGRIYVAGGAANFCFGRGGELFILNETRLWRAQLGPSVKGALLGI